jgi:hypothetical protein
VRLWSKDTKIKETNTLCRLLAFLSPQPESNW